jgi:uncharacterized membrane protein
MTSRWLIALGAGYLVCIALLALQIDRAFGLPAHPLIVHVPVVLIPLLVIATVAIVARPAWRERFGIAWAALGVVALAGTVLAAGAGEKWLDRKPPGQRMHGVLHDHKEAADKLRVLMFLFVAVILVVLVRDFLERSGRASVLSARALGTGMLVVTVVLAAGAGYLVVRTGHLGSKSVYGKQGDGGPRPPIGG